MKNSSWVFTAFILAVIGYIFTEATTMQGAINRIAIIIFWATYFIVKQLEENKK